MVSSTNITQETDKYFMILVKITFIIIVSLIIYAIYRYFIRQTPKNYELFTNNDVSQTDFPVTNNKFPDTIYEKSIREIYGNSAANSIMLCNLLGENCASNRKRFPVNIIKHIDGTILAVFNDGNMYSKEYMNDKLWYGPLKNSMPNNGEVPLRMITIAPNGFDLLGVGYDNQLYIKRADGSNNNLDLEIPWQLVANNRDIIYVLTDPQTTHLIAINTDGQLLINTKYELESDFEQATKLQIPILRACFDNNGYMLVITPDLKLYQMNDIDWRNSNIDYNKGANPTNVLDILYDNDMKLWGLVPIGNAGIIEIYKQRQIYYLSKFLLPDIETELGTAKNTFLMNDKEIIKAKTGVDMSIREAETGDSLDDDVNYANMRQILENKKKLRAFCASRSLVDPNKSTNYRDFELEDQINVNNNKLVDMKKIVSTMLKYDPDSKNITQSGKLLA